MLYKNLNSNALADYSYTNYSTQSFAYRMLNSNTKAGLNINSGSFILGDTSISNLRSNIVTYKVYLTPTNGNTYSNYVYTYTFPMSYSINTSKNIYVVSYTTPVSTYEISDIVIMHCDAYITTSSTTSGSIKFIPFKQGSSAEYVEFNTPNTISSSGYWGAFGYTGQYSVSTKKLYYTRAVYNEDNSISVTETNMSSTAISRADLYVSNAQTVPIPAMSPGKYAVIKFYSELNNYNSFVSSITCKVQIIRDSYASNYPPVVSQTVSSLTIPCTADGKPIDSFTPINDITEPKIFIPCRRNNNQALNYGSNRPSYNTTGIGSITSNVDGSSWANTGYTISPNSTDISHTPGFYIISPVVTVNKLNGTKIESINLGLVRSGGWQQYASSSQDFTFFNYNWNNGDPFRYYQYANIAYIPYYHLKELFYRYGECEIVLDVSITSNEYINTALTIATTNTTDTVKIKLYKKVVDILSPLTYSLETSSLFAVGNVPADAPAVPLKCSAYTENVTYVSATPYVVALSASNIITNNNTIGVPNHSFIDMDIVKYTFTSGTSFGGLIRDSIYYVTVVDANNVKLSRSSVEYLEKRYVTLNTNTGFANSPALTRAHSSGTSRTKVFDNAFLTLTGNTDTEQLPVGNNILILPSAALNPVDYYTAKVYDAKVGGKVMYSQELPVLTSTVLDSPKILTNLNSDSIREVFTYNDPNTPLLDAPNFTDIDSLPEYNTTNNKVNNTSINNFGNFNTVTAISNGNLTLPSDPLINTGHPVRFICNLKNPDISTIDFYNSIIYSSTHGFQTGNIFVYIVSDSMQRIKPLLNNNIYYVIKIDDNKFKLALTITDAVNNIPIFFVGVGTINGNRILEIGPDYITLANEHNFVDGNTYTYIQESYINASGYPDTNNLITFISGNSYSYSTNTLNTFQIPISTATNFGTCLGSNSWPKNINIFDTYYVIRVDAKTYKLSTTLKNAYNNISIPLLPATFSATAQLGTEVSDLNTSTPNFIVSKTIAGYAGKGSVCLKWSYTNGSTLTSSANIDGFIITLYAGNTDTDYTFGTDPANEFKYVVRAGTTSNEYVRSTLINNLDITKYYTIGIQAYRKVNKYIEVLTTQLNTKEIQASPILKGSVRLKFTDVFFLDRLSASSGITMPDGEVYTSTAVKFNDYLGKIPDYELSQGYTYPSYQLYINGNIGAVYLTDWYNAEALRADPYNPNNINKVYFAAGANQYKYLVKKQTLSFNYTSPERLDSKYTYPPQTDGGGGGGKK